MIIRIENIECRLVCEQCEIVKWFPNTYYGSEAQLESEGYKRIEHENGGFSYKRGFHNIHGSCFQGKESCCVIAFIDDDSDEGLEIRPVGARLLNLSKEERDIFFDVYKYVNDRALNDKGITEGHQCPSVNTMSVQT